MQRKLIDSTRSVGRRIEGKRAHRKGQADSCDVRKHFTDVPKLRFVSPVIAADVQR